MRDATFHHIGVPTNTRREGESFLEEAGVHVTDPDAHPFRVEYLRFEADSPMHEMLQNRTHAAFVVEDVEAALEGKNVVVEPFEVGELKVAFILHDELLVELMQNLGGEPETKGYGA